MRLFLSSMALFFVVVIGCATGGEKSVEPGQAQPKQSKSGPVTDYPSLIRSLRALGAGATGAGDVEQPFFSIKGAMIKVHGEDVQVFQYANAAAADAEAAPISRDGMAVGTRKIFWVGSPHFYKQGRLLVLYVGNNEKVLKTLDAVLGQQFAGQYRESSREKGSSPPRRGVRRMIGTAQTFTFLLFNFSFILNALRASAA